MNFWGSKGMLGCWVPPEICPISQLEAKTQHFGRDSGMALRLPLLISKLPWKFPEEPSYPFSLRYLDRRGPGFGLGLLEIIPSRAPFPHGNPLQSLHSLRVGTDNKAYWVCFHCPVSPFGVHFPYLVLSLPPRCLTHSCGCQVAQGIPLWWPS